MKRKKPLILVTNDDGITAPGIQHLIDVMKDHGDVLVVAPDGPQSGTGHAVTLNSVLHIEKISTDKETIQRYSCSGTPVDCVKFAVSELIKGKPDLCVSGINHGSNSSINVIYSGTMSAAVEAGIEGVPAIGFSLQDFNWNADFEPVKSYVRSITEKVLQTGLPENTVLNVNFPKLPAAEIKGIKICRQAKALWVERFDKRKTPSGRDYYWLTGEFKNLDHGQDTDEWALSNGYVSIVPVQFDLTAYHAMQFLNSWDL